MTTELHVIVGAGPVGSALARLLHERGHRVRVLTRSGRTIPALDVESVAVDASDPQALAAAAAGAQVLYNCANPGNYAAWKDEWPPLAASLLAAAEQTGAVLVTASNLYMYGPVTGPMTRATPMRPSDHKGAIRARMWQQTLEAHRAGRVRIAEARASDYIGPTLPVSSGLLAMYAAKTLAGKKATVFADPDQPHTWSAITDVAATLAVLGQDERAWGEAWIVPSHPPSTVREVLAELHEHRGLPAPRLSRMPRWPLKAGAAFIPMLREVIGVLYQFDAPFVADGSETTRLLGLEPTPWETIIDTTAEAWAARAAAPAN